MFGDSELSQDDLLLCRGKSSKEKNKQKRNWPCTQSIAKRSFSWLMDGRLKMVHRVRLSSPRHRTKIKSLITSSPVRSAITVCEAGRHPRCCQLQPRGDVSLFLSRHFPRHRQPGVPTPPCRFPEVRRPCCGVPNAALCSSRGQSCAST